ncbi:threonine-phosphate decarboxylase CobD [Domibacillus epiphyticus]|uniref:threonine-phosphate decarboxylase n=1 Tax=Domibacillus epiphyticus TaxID=1714355 RepID=A0A1V2AAR2_9BACI|nr:threonine-phosphate decarboxylase CobD [Domibacillus epiphyticus]OMP68085.1 threonine-phosphate decarboxylase [Domibacillus epiphyticus]
MNLPSHGANPSHLYNASGIARPDHVLDFSVNTNPLGPPEWLKEQWGRYLHTIEEYPDPTGYKAVMSIADKFDVAYDQVLLGNGAAEIIHFIARYTAGQHAVICTPAFSEYEDACQAYGCPIEYVPVPISSWQLPIDELVEQSKKAGVIFLCTPNNPTGQSFNEKDIVSLLDQTRHSNALIVIDEAFYDFFGDESLVKYIAAYPHLAVMHSMTKMYSIAGLRIGYVISSSPIISKLKQYRPHWNVNAIALQVAEEIARDHAHAMKTREMIKGERERMKDLLEKLGFLVLPSAVNFYLLKDPQLDNQKPILHFLLERGIVLRHTENFKGLDGKWLRSAVKREKENNRLIEALKEWRNKC